MVIHIQTLSFLITKVKQYILRRTLNIFWRKEKDDDILIVKNKTSNCTLFIKWETNKIILVHCTNIKNKMEKNSPDIPIKEHKKN